MINLKATEAGRVRDLKKALAFANGIINTVREPLVVLYPELTIHSVNKAFYRTFKTDPKETIGRHLYDLGNGQWNIPQLKKMLAQVFISKRSFHDFEVEHKFDDIGNKTMLLNGRKIPILHLNDPMTLLAIEDVTEKRELEKKVESETFVASENKRLIELAKQKDDFFSLTSHELKTPVTIIKVFINLLQAKFESIGENDTLFMFTKMNEQVNKLTHRVADLLDASKMESGKLKYDLTHFNFNDLVKEVANEMQLITQRHVIKVALVKKRVIVFADKERIEQAIINILSNAIKYSPKAKEIKVTTTSTATDVMLSIKDFGIGLPAKDQNKVFEKFFRVSGKAENTFPGLGLGLFIASEIITRHKGNLSVKSKKGVGSTFTFTLPAAITDIETEKRIPLKVN